MSRLQRIQAEGGTPDLPPLPAAGYLVDYLFDAGPMTHTGMGPAPLSHLDLRAWQDNCGVPLQPWEVRALRRLSVDYTAAAQAAADPDAPAPYVPAVLSDERRAEVARKLKAAFGARTRAAPGAKKALQ